VINDKEYLIEKELIQLTPHISFEKKPRLRASEFKPRFDRFIFENATEEEKKILKTDGEEIRLNYKLKFSFFETNNTKEDNVTKKLYFANMSKEEKNEEEKNSLSMSKKINMKIYVFDKELKSILEKYLSSFLFFYNFGSRQSKGFGSYQLEKNTKVNKLENKELYLLEKFEINRNNSIKQEKVILNKIVYFQKLKDNIFDYYKNRNYIDTLRNHIKFLLKKDIKKEKISNFEDYKYIYDIFGLKTEDKINKTEILKKEFKSNKEDNLIERISSPFTFKPYKKGNEIFLFLIYDKKQIELLKEYCDKEKIKLFSKTENIDIEKEFSIDDELYEAVDEILNRKGKLINNLEELNDLIVGEI
jgi:hypothetical protein